MSSDFIRFRDSLVIKERNSQQTPVLLTLLKKEVDPYRFSSLGVNQAKLGLILGPNLVQGSSLGRTLVLQLNLYWLN